MDEIFDRLKTIKFKRKNLFIPLILSEILGILVLVWYLKTPLIQKYLLEAPNSYSVEEMEAGKQYLLRQGDFIKGKTKPQTTLQIILYPDRSKYSTISDSEGNFNFQIPPEIGLKEYRLMIISDDIRPTTIKDLRIRVVSNNILGQLTGSLIK